MSNDPTAAAEKALAKILNEASGFDLQELDRRASFLELGFDSLFLIQFTQKIKSQLQVKVTFRQLIEEIPTLDALIKFVAQHASTSLPAAPASVSEALPGKTAAALPLPAQSPLQSVASDAAEADAAEPWQPAAATSTVPPPVPPPVPMETAVTSVVALPEPDAITLQLGCSGAAPNRQCSPHAAAALEQIIAQQNQLMSMQLQLLSGLRGGEPSEEDRLKPALQQAAGEDRLKPALQQAAGEDRLKPALQRAAGEDRLKPAAEKPKFERFGPYKPVRKSASGGLTEQQQASLQSFIERFISKTRRSREHAQKHRPHFADPRGVAGYRRIWKSIVYQISVERSAGSKLWDVDGNEYIDIAMGFGLNLFGQSPDFVTAALHQQLDRGVEVGPQSPLAGEVAALLCDFSRKDRVTFCNTGSEAVMAAMRLARTVTGKSKIVFFNKDYHGNFEEVLLRSNQIGNRRRTQPAAPGVPSSFADNAIVLDYGTPAALESIRAHADEIAAVLVEPVQSADPFNQPREFLHDVRRLTQQCDIALIMDEVITGFRAAQGGAQEWFDVWGDMATYGKVLGGGLPIGALAGSNRFMDALDGGAWKYEDDSEPAADMTFFAGTFVRHPLAMTAAHQILMKVKEEGPELQERLTAQTTRMVDELNHFFASELFPFRVAQFTSLFRFMFPLDLEYADLLYFHLLERGIFTRGWGDNCFLSTAHSDEDVAKIIQAVKASCLEIRAGGFMPAADKPAADKSEACGGSLPPNGRSTAGGAVAIASRPRAPSAPAAAVVVADSQPIGVQPSSLQNTGLGDLAADRISTLEEIQPEGELPPLFCMPAADGLSLVYHHLAEELGEEQPVYGLTSPGVYGEEVPYTIEAMAARFVADIREFRPQGPYLLLGYCSGGTIALEAAQQLVAAGQEVAFVAGIETYDWSTAQSSRPTPLIKAYYNLQRLEFHLRNFLLLDVRDQWSFLKSKLNRAKTRSRNWRGMLAGWFSKQQAVSAAGEVNMHELWRLHDAQADRYRPLPYPGKLLLIRPRKDYRSYVGKEDLVATQGVKVVRMPAFPAGLMTPPYVSQVAQLIRETIREGLSEQTPAPAPAVAEHIGEHVAPEQPARSVLVGS